jgi:hypothetical protein
MSFFSLGLQETDEDTVQPSALEFNLHETWVNVCVINIDSSEAVGAGFCLQIHKPLLVRLKCRVTLIPIGTRSKPDADEKCDDQNVSQSFWQKILTLDFSVTRGRRLFVFSESGCFRQWSGTDHICSLTSYGVTDMGPNKVTSLDEASPPTLRQTQNRV